MRKINLYSLLTILILLSGMTILNASPRHHTTVPHPQIKQKTILIVDINKATSAQLQTLKGIGLKKAAAIVAYREKHGAFKSIDDLTKVKGISQKIVTNNKARLQA